MTDSATRIDICPNCSLSPRGARWVCVSIVVASRDDPYCSIRLAGAYARGWGSEFVSLQNAGHINIESGHGDWPLGLALLRSLVPATVAA